MKQNKVRQAPHILVKRSDIHFAEYNPRSISEEAKALIKRKLKDDGLYGGIVWNKTTGNLVGGHQRLEQMDAINRYDPDNPETDYELYVDVAEKDLNDEISLNLFLNNKNAQGEFDDAKLRQIFTEHPDLDYSIAGFDTFDMELLGFGETADLLADYANAQWRESQLTGEGYEAADDAQRNDRMADASASFKAEGENTKIDRSKNFYEDTAENQLARHAEIQKIKDRIVNQNLTDKDGGLLSYVTISFQSPTERDSFLDMFGLPFGTRYINGKEFVNILEFGPDGNPEDDENDN